MYCLVPKCRLNFRPTAQKPIEYKHGPRSVAIGDFDNDTVLDMVIANHLVNKIAVYLGNSDGSFKSPTTYSTGSYSSPYMVTVADFNNDKRLDIAVANFGTNNIVIFHGFGDGSFANQTQLSTGSSRPIAIIGAHFNNDTLLDIAIANYGNHSISILYQYGNGSFSLPITYPTGYDSLPSSLAAGDFNNDNYLDLAIANYGTNNIVILFGNSNSTFAKQITISTGIDSQPHSIAVGDFNADTFLDIAIANSGSHEVGVLLNNGNETFANPVNYFINSASPIAIWVRDFNQDNRLDIITTNRGTDNIAILLGYRDGSFENPIMYQTGATSSISVVVDDFNKDHRLDIVVVNNDTGAINILFGRYEGFQNQTRYSVGSNPQSLAIGDVNNDTRLDIVVANSWTSDVSVLLGYGNGSFENQTRYSVGSYPQSVVIGDVNNDARLDIVVANLGSNDVSVLLGYGNGSFENQKRYSIGFYPQSVAVGDVNNDTRLDIVVANTYSNDVSVLLGYGNGSFENQKRYSVGSWPQSVTIGDVNNDARLDIVVANYYNNDVSVLLGYGNGSFENQKRYSVGSNPQSVAIGDVNNDTRLDIVVANWGSNDVSVLLQYNRGRITYEISLASGGGSSLRCVVIGDLNNDTNLDIILANYGTNNLGVLFGYGNASFENQMMLNTGMNSHPISIAVGEFNGDREVDIAVANHGTKHVDMMLGNGKGIFTIHTSYEIGFDSPPLVIASGDFNNDARSEIRLYIYDVIELKLNIATLYSLDKWVIILNSSHIVLYFSGNSIDLCKMRETFNNNW
ncbi:unnamed protein product [Rotaria sp. Silwood1]|nr:unnamed protein product [Rotaria sp. Silwood1]